MGARIGKGKRQHQKKCRQDESDVTYHCPAHPADFQADVSRHLHDGCSGDCLAERHAGLKGLAVNPLLLLDGHFADVRDHGRPAEGGDPQPEKRTE